MPGDRMNPYGAFNFSVRIGSGEVSGGFSDVSGLTAELKIAEYREGTDPQNHTRKVGLLNSATDVSLKRGIISSKDIWTWINDARTKGEAAKKEVVVTLNNEAGQPVQSWYLRRVLPLKYTGPTLAAKGGTDVAMEELVLSCEAIDFPTT